MARSIAKACLQFTGLFEAELLTELILRFWNHPLAEDAGFRSSLLEAAAEALRAAIAGEQLFEDLEPKNVNFVAALWYAESIVISDANELPESQLELRRKWLDSVSRALPSCFCDPDSL
jgi:hypothetical protein